MRKTMKKNIKQRKQRGFALIEVMIAALVLTVGGIAYMKLQRVGLQQGFNNATRSQGIALVTGFVEQLRSNTNYLQVVGLPADGDSFKGGTISKPTNAANCDSKSESTKKTCAETIFALHQYLTSEQMKGIVPANNSLLCYTQSSATTGLMRVTFIWRDNSEVGKSITLSSCPDFNEDITQNNSVTIYAQL